MTASGYSIHTKSHHQSERILTVLPPKKCVPGIFTWRSQKYPNTPEAKSWIRVWTSQTSPNFGWRTNILSSNIVFHHYVQLFFTLVLHVPDISACSGGIIQWVWWHMLCYKIKWPDSFLFVVKLNLLNWK